MLSDGGIYRSSARKTHLNEQISELRGMLEGGSAQTGAAAEPAPRKLRRMSAALHLSGDSGTSTRKPEQAPTARAVK
jgi:hypothetical protein